MLVMSLADLSNTIGSSVCATNCACSHAVGLLKFWGKIAYIYSNIVCRMAQVPFFLRVHSDLHFQIQTFYHLFANIF